jgi:hypothetical protein
MILAKLASRRLRRRCRVIDARALVSKLHSLKLSRQIVVKFESFRGVHQLRCRRREKRHHDLLDGACFVPQQKLPKAIINVNTGSRYGLVIT